MKWKESFSSVDCTKGDRKDVSKEIPTYEVLAQAYDVTRGRIQQIVATTLEKLKPLLGHDDIHPDVFPQEFEKVRLIIGLQNL